MSNGKHRKPKTTNPRRRIALGASVLLGGAAIPATFAGNASAATEAEWDRTAQCESTGNWAINTGNGFYGGVQFLPSTWAAYGGTAFASNAHLASKAQQIEIAERVLWKGHNGNRPQGKGAWPVCGVGLSNTPYGGGTTTPPPVTPPPATRPPVTTPPSNDDRRPESRLPHEHYTVKAGDTLYLIAKAKGVKGGWQELYRWNTKVVSDSSRIYPDQELNIPRPDNTDPKPAPGTGDSVQAEVTALVNAERAKVGLKAVAGEGALNIYAANWSGTMAREGRMYHSKLGFPGSPRGENVAVGYRSAAAVMKGWMESPGHKANILGNGYTKIGVGLVVDSGGRHYWTQVFAGGTATAPPPPAPKPVPPKTDTPPATAGVVHPVPGGRLGQGYGNPAAGYTLGYHTGIDISAPQGTRMLAAAAGVVVASDTAGAYGINVQIRHADGRHTFYAHMAGKTVSVGQTVKAGDLIGYVGSTGNSRGPHLHMELRLAPRFAAGNFLDPAAWLRANGVTL